MKIGEPHHQQIQPVTTAVNRPYRNAVSRGCIFHHQARGRFPLPTTCLRRGEARRGRQAEKWGEGQGEGISKERDNSIERTPLSPALSPLVPRRERGHFSDGGCIKMRPSGATSC